MADPNYRYTPWTPERRRRASEAQKERWRLKREKEQRDYERQQASAIGRTESRIREEHQNMEAARKAYFRAKTAIEQLEEARNALLKADAILKRFGIQPL